MNPLPLCQYVAPCSVGRVRGQAILASQGSNSIVPWRNKLTPQVNCRMHASIRVGAAADSGLRFDHGGLNSSALQDPRGGQAGIASSNYDDSCLVHFTPNTSVVQQVLHKEVGYCKMDLVPLKVEPEERQADVSRAVVDIASARGFEDVTIRSIARELGTSTTAITHYFLTREQLIRRAVSDELSRFEQGRLRAIDGLTGFDALRTVIAYTVFDSPSRPRHFWMQVIIGAQRDPILRSELTKFNEKWEAAIRALLVEEGIPEAAIDCIADQLDTVISGSVMLAFETESHTVAARRRGLESLVEMIIAAAAR